MAVKVVVYDSVIKAHFTPGGVVYRNGSRLGAIAQTEAKHRVGKRTRTLERSIYHGSTPRGLKLDITLRATAPYAPFVEHGTTGPITAKRGRYLRLPPYGGYRGLRLTSVSGQRAQHFLEDGMSRALVTLGYGPYPG